MSSTSNSTFSWHRRNNEAAKLPPTHPYPPLCRILRRADPIHDKGEITMDTAEPSRKPILIAVILGLILIAATTSICLLMKHGQISLSPETHKTDATSERAGDNPFASGSRSKQGTEDASSNAPTADDMKIVAAGGTGLTYKDSASHYILELPASWYGRSSVQKTLSMQDTNDLTIDESYYLDEIHLFTIRRTERGERVDAPGNSWRIQHLLQAHASALKGSRGIHPLSFQDQR